MADMIQQSGVEGDLITPLYKKRLQEKLQSILPRASEASLHLFLEFILKSELPDRSLAVGLLDDKCSSNEILMVLIYCRNVMISMSKNYSGAEKDKYLKNLFLNHDRLTVWLMQTIEETHDLQWKTLQVQLLQEEHEHRLTRACHEWKKQKEITIYNYYQEMPISASLELLKVGARSFTVKRNNDVAAVLLVSDKEDTAFTRMPSCDLCLGLTVVEATTDTIHLRYGNFSLVKQQRRREVRALNTTPIQATLRNSEFQTWDCNVNDLSASGLGLYFEQEMTFQKGDAYIFTVWLHGEKIMGRGVIAWVNNSAGHCEAGLSIEYNKVSYNYLNLEVKRRIKISMLELQLKGAPKCLLTD